MRRTRAICLVSGQFASAIGARPGCCQDPAAKRRDENSTCPLILNFHLSGAKLACFASRDHDGRRRASNWERKRAAPSRAKKCRWPISRWSMSPTAASWPSKSCCAGPIVRRARQAARDRRPHRARRFRRELFLAELAQRFSLRQGQDRQEFRARHRHAEKRQAREHHSRGQRHRPRPEHVRRGRGRRNPGPACRHSRPRRRGRPGRAVQPPAPGRGHGRLCFSGKWPSAPAPPLPRPALPRRPAPPAPEPRRATVATSRGEIPRPGAPHRPARRKPPPTV